MPLLDSSRRALAEGLAAISYANPFLPERVELERRLLGADFVEVGAVKSRDDSRDEDHESANTALLLSRGEELVEHFLARAGAARPAAGELAAYEGAGLFVLYHRWRDPLLELVVRLETEEGDALRVPWYARFREEAERLLRPGGTRLPGDLEPAHLLALFFQLARAFHQVYENLVGTSAAAGRLRAAVWQSIFTHDMRRYQRSLYRRMADMSTLVTGPSGTGKELVARAVGRSSYVPFDEGSGSFHLDPQELFLPLNLSALSPQLVESELFGYRKGAFTGALADRAGWFETCPEGGAVFLDEIGEIGAEIQVKLLRVLETRRFQRIGDTRSRVFRGKLVSATNRGLEREMAAGRFREDLYYRICSDRIVTPSLVELVGGDPGELGRLLLYIARRQIGEQGDELARETLAWIEGELGLDYAWPGNFRELEQCLRSVLVRKRYEPRTSEPLDPEDELVARLRAVDIGADELLGRYCTLAYRRIGSFEGTARRLGLDRRTVKARLDHALLERLGGRRPG